MSAAKRGAERASATDPVAEGSVPLPEVGAQSAHGSPPDSAPTDRKSTRLNSSHVD